MERFSRVLGDDRDRFVLDDQADDPAAQPTTSTVHRQDLATQ
jgi:hypothetical protein